MDQAAPAVEGGRRESTPFPTFRSETASYFKHKSDLPQLGIASQDASRRGSQRGAHGSAIENPAHGFPRGVWSRGRHGQRQMKLLEQDVSWHSYLRSHAEE
jgi:hypothetical protein